MRAPPDGPAAHDSEVGRLGPASLRAFDGGAVGPRLSGGEQLRRAAALRARRRTLAGRHDVGGGGRGGRQAAAEVGGVEFVVPDRLVDALQFGQRERGAEERGGEVGALEFVAGPFDRVAQDPLVVEGEFQGAVEHVGDGPQAGVVGVGAGVDPPDLRRDGEVADGHHVAPRVATRVAVGAELREMSGGVDAGLLAGARGWRRRRGTRRDA